MMHSVGSWNVDLAWPALPLDAWRDTCQTLQLWTQVAGKIRMTLSPKLNHWWNVALYVNSRGLTTSPVPYGAGAFEIQFNFLEHLLEVRTSDGDHRSLPLAPQPVAVFYEKLMAALRSVGITVAINTSPRSSPTRFRSSRTISTPPTTPSMPTASGGSCYRPMSFWTSSEHVSSASAAPFTSFGVVSTSPVRASPAALPRRARGSSPARPTRTRPSAPDSGLGAASSMARPSTPTRRPSRPACRTSRCAPPPPSGAASFPNSS